MAGWFISESAYLERRRGRHADVGVAHVEVDRRGAERVAADENDATQCEHGDSCRRIGCGNAHWMCATAVGRFDPKARPRGFGPCRCPPRQIPGGRPLAPVARRERGRVVTDLCVVSLVARAPGGAPEREAACGSGLCPDKQRNLKILFYSRFILRYMGFISFYFLSHSHQGSSPLAGAPRLCRQQTALPARIPCRKTSSRW